MTTDAEHRDSTIEVGVSIVHNPTTGFGDPTPEDLDRINTRVPGRLNPEDLFILPCFPSTSRLDSHFTRMALSTLENYARDADTGTAVMNSHKTGGFFAGSAELPIGRSFLGELQDGADIEQARVYARAYLLRGYHPNGQSQPGTDDLIRAVSGGVVTDISVGFSLGKEGFLRCNVCNANNMSWMDMCEHVPGEEYDIPVAEGGGRRLAFDWVEKAKLREFSTVYKGSTPSAVIARMERLADEGRASKGLLTRFEDRAGVRLFQRHVVTSAPPRTPIPVTTPPTLPIPPVPKERVMTLQDLLARFSITADDQVSLDRAVELLDAEIKRREAAAVADLDRKVIELDRRAKDGDELRAALIEDALDWGVRAEGDFFQREAQLSLLRDAPVATVRVIRDGWRKRAEQTFGAPGTASLRLSQPLDPDRRSNGSEDTKFKVGPVSAPPEAYGAGTARR